MQPTSTQRLSRAERAQSVKIHGEEVKVRAAIRRFEDYSGHADGPELLQWLRERLPIAKAVFLTHGEEEPQVALAGAMAGEIIAADRIGRPRLDDVYDVTGDAPVRREAEIRPRLSPDKMARPDWHNELAELILDINDEMGKAADEKARTVVIRRLKRALDEARGAMPPPNARQKGRDEGRGGARGFDEG